MIRFYFLVLSLTMFSSFVFAGGAESDGGSPLKLWMGEGAAERLRSSVIEDDVLKLIGPHSDLVEYYGDSLGTLYLTEDQVRAFLENDGSLLKPLLLKIFHSIHEDDIEDPLLKPMWQKIMNSEVSLNQDVMGSEYHIDGPCKDDLEARTEHAVLFAPVCFDVEQLSEQAFTLDRLLGLAFHEHAHHFGVMDHSEDIDKDQVLFLFFADKAADWLLENRPEFRLHLSDES